MSSRSAALLAFAVFITTPAFAATIDDDRGGRLQEYAYRAQRYRQSGEQVRIMGLCGSACTLYLSVPNLCLGPRARLLFHTLQEGLEKDAPPAPWATEWIMKEYPDWVRDWIAQQGGLSREIMEMPHAFAANFLEKCQ
jgi:hypothetical protein